MLVRRAFQLVYGNLALLAFADSAKAGDLEFNTLYRSPYYLGRGDTGVATADKFEAIFYNPAGLAQGNGLYKETVLVSPSFEVSTKTKDLVRQVMIEKNNDPETLKTYVGRNMHLGVTNFTGVVFRRMALGLLLSSDTNIMLAKSVADRGLETLRGNAAVNRVAVLSVAESIWNQQLSFGLTGKYIMRNETNLEVSALDSANISNQLESSDAKVQWNGFGVDFGLMYNRLKSPFHLGLHVENMGSTSLKSIEGYGASRHLPQIVTLGTAYELGTKISSMMLRADFRDVTSKAETNTFKRLHLGAELRFANFFGFEGGLNQGYPTAGLFVNLYVLRLDIGVYSQEIGNSAGIRPDQRLYFRLKAGF